MRLAEQIKATQEPIYKNEDIFYAKLGSDYQFWQILYESTCQVLTRDQVVALQLHVDQSKTLREGQIAASSVTGALGPFPSNEDMIDDEHGWRSLVRRHLAAEVHDPGPFCEAACVAFPRLQFSAEFPDCLNTFDPSYNDFAQTLIQALTALNDRWNKFEGGDLPATLREFSSLTSIETTLEGNGERKNALTFKFAAKDVEAEEVLCEPHMKLSQSSTAGDNTFYYNRIYFSARCHSKFGDKILIGHAGKHR
jgi:hypothetical protein